MKSKQQYNFIANYYKIIAICNKKMYNGENQISILHIMKGFLWKLRKDYSADIRKVPLMLL